MARTRSNVVRTADGQEVQSIQPGTPEMEAYLRTGYGISIEVARKIVDEWENNPQSKWPIERYEQAKAMLAAYEASPEPVSERPAWRLTPHPPRPRRRTS